MDKAKTSVETAVTQRNQAYAAELQRQRSNDALCKRFASMADPRVQAILEAKDIITQSKAELEEQLKFVNSKILCLPDEESKLKPIRDLFAQMESLGITNNKYTTFTSKDIDVQFEQYKNFLHKKVKMLEEEIEHNKLRGISQEQFNEIEKTFKQFDSDGSGAIDKSELKACLYSLGEEKSRTEVEEIMKKYGTPGKGILYNNFREFMIDVVGVSDTKEDILDSFKILNKGNETASVDKLNIYMKNDDIQYYTSTAKKEKDNTYEYKLWTDDMFSR